MSTLPNELWMSVFDFLSSPSDLAKVLRASKLFYNLVIRILHRKLIWNDPRHFAQALHFWEDNTDIIAIPRSLTVGISKVQAPLAQVDRQDHALVVALNGTLGHSLPMFRVASLLFFDLPQGTAAMKIKPSFVASEELYHAMTARIMTFSQLTNLTFRNAILPTNIYDIIHSIPSLRALHIEFCSFDASTTESACDHTALPITELSLLGLDNSRYNSEAIFLAKARDLRSLRFDLTACVFRLFTRLNARGRHAVPQHLESIDLQLPEKKYWPSNQQEAQQLYITPLIAFLAMCPNVVHMSISNYAPEFTVPDNILPNLCSYQGAMSTVVTMVGNRPIAQLEIRDAGSKISDIIDTLTQVGEGHSSLQELTVHVPLWDDEVLYAVAHLFPNLRKLCILYASGSPSEDLILSVGPHFVARAPYMHTVHIFSPRDRSAAELLVPKNLGQTNELIDFDERVHYDPEAELKELVNCWDRYCPRLQEVQLLNGFVWRKAQARSGGKPTSWEKRLYQLVDGERDYGC